MPGADQKCLFLSPPPDPIVARDQRSIYLASPAQLTLNPSFVLVHRNQLSPDTLARGRNTKHSRRWDTTPHRRPLGGRQGSLLPVHCPLIQLCIHSCPRVSPNRYCIPPRAWSNVLYGMRFTVEGVCNQARPSCGEGRGVALLADGWWQCPM